MRRHQGTLIDITERRDMEQRLHREQEFARRLVESFPDLVRRRSIAKAATPLSALA